MTKNRGKNLRKWDDNFYVDAYILARAGATNGDIAAAFQIDQGTMSDWLKHRPALKTALEKARTHSTNGNAQTFMEYVYKKLPEPLQKLWDEIVYWSDHQNSTSKIEALLRGQSNRVRQMLWVHSLISSNFNASRACAQVQVSKRQLDEWVAEDPDFPALLNEIEFHRKNFFETALMDLVEMRNFSAVIFANKTKNRDRGYGDRVEVVHSGSIAVDHVVRVDTLNLPLEVRAQLLQALRVARETANAEQAAIDLPTSALRVGGYGTADDE